MNKKFKAALIVFICLFALLAAVVVAAALWVSHNTYWQDSRNGKMQI